MYSFDERTVKLLNRVAANAKQRNFYGKQQHGASFGKLQASSDRPTSPFGLKRMQYSWSSGGGSNKGARVPRSKSRTYEASRLGTPMRYVHPKSRPGSSSGRTRESSRGLNNVRIAPGSSREKGSHPPRKVYDASREKKRGESKSLAKSVPRQRVDYQGRARNGSKRPSSAFAIGGRRREASASSAVSKSKSFTQKRGQQRRLRSSSASDSLTSLFRVSPSSDANGRNAPDNQKMPSVSRGASAGRERHLLPLREKSGNRDRGRSAKDASSEMKQSRKSEGGALGEKGAGVGWQPLGMRGEGLIQDGVVFAESADCPGIPVVYRTRAAREKNPERLSLDRRSLKMFPLLHGEHLLRLLSFQDNNLTRIANLNGLPNLIFLDLYNNAIEKITNLSCVPSLRVLMLGKNKIERIEGLNHLRKLDVLDLHSNRIKQISGLSHLVQLRVLNLSGNQISVVDRLSSLISLTELNMRRNVVTSAHGLAYLPALQRIFFSNNKIRALEDIASVFGVAHLLELSLDGNPVSSGPNSAQYRQTVLASGKNLRHLDARKVTEEERKNLSVVQQHESQRQRSKSKSERESEERTLLIQSAKHAWSSASVTRKDSRRSREVHFRACLGALRKSAEATPEPSIPAAQDIKTEPISQSNASAAVAKNAKNSPDAAAAAPRGVYEVEVVARSVKKPPHKRLVIYGNAFSGLLDPSHRESVKGVLFKFSIAGSKLLKAVRGLRHFESLEYLILSHNEIVSLSQLRSLCGALPASVGELCIELNHVTTLKHYRVFAIFYAKHVTVLDGIVITDEERQNASKLMEPLDARCADADANAGNRRGKFDRKVHAERSRALLSDACSFSKACEKYYSENPVMDCR